MAAKPINPPGAERFLPWLPVAAVAALIFSASSLPGRDIPSLFPLQDVFFHGTIYGILAWFFKRALHKTYPRLTTVTLVLVTACFIFIYGASDEFHQLFVPGRSCDIMDLLVDMAGGLAGNLLYR